MKKKLYLLLVLVVLIISTSIILAGCGGGVKAGFDKTEYESADTFTESFINSKTITITVGYYYNEDLSWEQSVSIFGNVMKYADKYYDEGEVYEETETYFEAKDGKVIEYQYNEDYEENGDFQWRIGDTYTAEEIKDKCDGVEFDNLLYAYLYSIGLGEYGVLNGLYGIKDGLYGFDDCEFNLVDGWYTGYLSDDCALRYKLSAGQLDAETIWYDTDKDGSIVSTDKNVTKYKYQIGSEKVTLPANREKSKKN